MIQPTTLFLYEEIMLLALRDDKGTLATNFTEYAVAGAVLAELLLTERLRLDGTRKQLVHLVGSAPSGDPILDECLGKIKDAKRRANLKTWVSRLARIKDLRHKVARQLCRRGILRADESTVLLFFKRKIYPELDPVPEKAIVARLQHAIFESTDAVDVRTALLISLANGLEILSHTFGRKAIKQQKQRLARIGEGEMIGKATKEAIQAVQAAVMIATITPVIIAH